MCAAALGGNGVDKGINLRFLAGILQRHFGLHSGLHPFGINLTDISKDDRFMQRLQTFI